MLEKIKQIYQNLVKKGWSEDFLRIRELNYLEQPNKLTSPYSQNYLVHKCVSMLAVTSAQCPLLIYRGEEPLPDTDKLVRLFNIPNPYQSRFELWESLISFLYITGEAFLYFSPSVGMQAGTSTYPAEIYSLNPKFMKHVVDKDGVVTSWIWNGKQEIPESDITHFTFFTTAGYRGLSPLDPVKLELEGDHLAALYNRKFFANSASPDGVITIDKDKPITDAELQALKKQWNQGMQGAENAHKTAFLKGGMTYNRVQFTQREMEFLEGRKFTRDQVLSIFGVPKTVAGYTEDINFATAQAQSQVFWKNTVKPLLIRIQEKLNSDFFMLKFPGLECQFDFASIGELQEDINTKITGAAGLLSLGYTRDEINERLQLGMPEETEPDGDVRRLPINLVEVGEDSTTEVTPQKEYISDIESIEVKEVKLEVPEMAKSYHRNFNRIRNNFERQFHSKVKRHIFDQRRKILSILDNHTKDIVEEQMLIEALNIFGDEKKKLIKMTVPLMADIMETSGKMAIELLGHSRDFILDTVVINSRANLLAGIEDTIFAQIKNRVHKGMKAGDSISSIAESIKEVYNFATARANTIAKTEVGCLMNTATFKEYKEGGVPKKAWIGAVEREEHFQNAAQGSIPIDEPFQNGQMEPGSGSADQVINCHCCLIPITNE
jgi:HK97 family phage portal protein